jgi:phosphatidylserine/phosphatidylglycerophosphate/cardiolipin synthase-like enzyme
MKKECDISFAVTGKYWIGSSAGSVLTAIRQVPDKAKEEVQIAVYSFGDNTVGFMEILESLLEKRIRVQLLINRFLMQPPDAKQKIMGLKAKYGNLTVFSFEPIRKHHDLHAKILVVDREYAIVGSPNISFHGYVSNHELAVIIQGEELAGKISALLDKLARSPETREVKGA